MWHVPTQENGLVRTSYHPCLGTSISPFYTVLLAKHKVRTDPSVGMSSASNWLENCISHTEDEHIMLLAALYF